MIGALVTNAAHLLAPGDWENLALVNRSWNRRLHNGPSNLERGWREAIYRTMKGAILVACSDDDGYKRGVVYQKIFSLKFYQVSSFINQYDKLKDFRFRYFSLPWANLVEVPLTMYKVFHPGVILLSSRIAPGQFWARLREYVERQSFYHKPHLFANLDDLEKKIWFFFVVIRGVPLFSLDEPNFYAMKEFAKKYREQPDLFAKYMEGKWCHTRYVLHHYERNYNSHFPVPCKKYPPFHFCVSEVLEGQQWEDWTDVYVTEGQIFDDTIYI